MERLYILSYFHLSIFFIFYLCGEVLCNGEWKGFIFQFFLSFENVCNGLCHLSWLESVCGKVFLCYLLSLYFHLLYLLSFM